MSIILIDGNYTVPQPMGEPRLTAPLPGVATQYILQQDFVQYGPNAVSGGGKFSPLALNTIFGRDFTSNNTPLFTNFFLTAESPLEDVGGGLVKWTRTYCVKPATRYEATNLAYTFPGYYQAYTIGASTFSVTGRLPTPLNASCKIQYDYYLIGEAGSGLAPPDCSDFTMIPTINRMRWGYNAFNGAFTIGFVDINPPMLWDAGLSALFANGTNGTIDGSTPLNDAAIRALITPGGLYAQGQSLTTSQYLFMVKEGGLFVAEDSAVSRWQGNIFQRVTKYVVAK